MNNLIEKLVRESEFESYTWNYQKDRFHRLSDLIIQECLRSLDELKAIKSENSKDEAFMNSIIEICKNKITQTFKE